MKGLVEAYEAGACAYALSLEYNMPLRMVYRRLHAAKGKVRAKGATLRLTEEVLERAIQARGNPEAMKALAEEVGLNPRYLRKKATEAFYERHTIDRRGT